MQQIPYRFPYRYEKGDILRLRHSSPLAPAGDYVLLSADDTVCLSRRIRSTRGHRISKKRVYMLITDLCMFVETGHKYRFVETGHRYRDGNSPAAAAAGGSENRYYLRESARL